MAQTKQVWMTRNSLVVPPLPQANSSMLERCLKPSTKLPADRVADIRPQDGPVYRVDFHARVAKTIQRYGLENDDFNPTVLQMIEDLESDPKRFAKKSGDLAEARSYRLSYRSSAWRAVFVVDDVARVVKIIALDRHDEAYRQASRRID